MRIFAVLLLATTIGCSDSKEPGPKTYAAAVINVATLEADETYTQGSIRGSAEFVYQDGITTLTVQLSGMEPNGSHAMHLHEGTFAEPGRHWNQGSFVSFCREFSLGEVWAKTFAGDVGNINIDSEGNGFFTMKTDLWKLGTSDKFDITNTVLFVHQNFEDFANECDPNHGHDHGHSNAKIAGGTVVLDAQLLQ